MATGYTYIIEEDPDLTLRAFTLRCARAIVRYSSHQRDEGVDALPRPPVLSNYHREEAHRNEARLLELRGMTGKGLAAIFEAECVRHEREAQASTLQCKERSTRYQAMREKVEAWSPPTDAHECLKKFMLEQIEESDPNPEPYIYDLRGTSTPDQWLAAHIQICQENIGYHREKQAEEEEHYARAVKWFEELYAAFKDKP